MNRQERREAERLRLKQERKHRREDNAATAQTTTSGEVSEARLEANRANALLSTGPKTKEGKANSRENSFKHGLYSKQLVLKSENPAELDALKADLRAEHQPATLTEEILVNELAEHYWRIRRARFFETQFTSDGSSTNQMNAVARLMSSAERGFHKALKTLREIQKQRGFVPQPIAATICDQSKTAENTEPGAANQPTRAATVTNDSEWDAFEASMAAAFPEVAAEIAAEEAAEKASKLTATR